MEWKYASAATCTSPEVFGNPPSDAHSSANSTFQIEALDIYSLETSVTIPYTDQELPMEALVKNGYLGNTPMTPSLAISLKTLELFRRIRLRKSSFSAEAFAKVLCDLYSVCCCSVRFRWLMFTRLISRFHTADATALRLLICLKSMSQSFGWSMCSLVSNLGATSPIGESNTPVPRVPMRNVSVLMCLCRYF